MDIFRFINSKDIREHLTEEFPMFRMANTLCMIY